MTSGATIDVVANVPVIDNSALGIDDDAHPDRGDGPPGSQQLRAGTPPDIKEAWAFSPEHHAGSSPMQGLNQWPDLAGFQEPITADAYVHERFVASMMSA